MTVIVKVAVIANGSSGNSCSGGGWLHQYAIGYKTKVDYWSWKESMYIMQEATSACVCYLVCSVRKTASATQRLHFTRHVATDPIVLRVLVVGYGMSEWAKWRAHRTRLRERGR
jgi:hypothetical protein